MKRLLALLLLALAAPVHAQLAEGDPVCSVSNDPGGATQTASLPTTTSNEGDLIFVAAVTYVSGGDVGDVFTTPSGWTQDTSATLPTTVSAPYYYLYWRAVQAGGEGSTLDITSSDTGVNTNFLACVIPGSASDSLKLSATGTGTSTSLDFPSGTATGTGGLIIRVGSIDGDSETATPSLTGHTALGYQEDASPGNGGTIIGYVDTQPSTSVGTAALTITSEQWHAHTFVVGEASAGGGVYDTTPTVASQTATAYTITGSLDASGTVDAVACLKDQTAPTIAQVQAGDCTGDVAAEDTDTDSPASGPFDFSLALTPTDAFPIYDLYVTDGTTLTTLAEEMLDPPTTCGEGADEACQFITVASIGSGSVFEDFNTAETPDIAANDVITAPTHVSPGLSGGIGTHDGSNNAATLTDSTRSWNDDDYNTLTVSNVTDGSSCTITDSTSQTIVCTLSGGTDDDWDVDDVYEVKYPLTISTAGHFSYDDFSEGLQQRAFNITIYDVSAEGFHAEDIDFIANNNAPECDSTSINPLVLDEGVAMTTVDFDDHCPDPDAGDQPTYAYTTGVPPAGMSLNAANGELTGNPTPEDEAGNAVVVTATDEAEATDTLSFTDYTVDTWLMPDITGDTVTAGEGTVVATAGWRAGELEISTSSACSDTVASGDIISQVPTASSAVDDPYEPISAVVSTGACAVGLGKRTKGVTLPGVSMN